jgi:hypothetical protein
MKIAGVIGHELSIQRINSTDFDVRWGKYTIGTIVWCDSSFFPDDDPYRWHAWPQQETGARGKFLTFRGAFEFILQQKAAFISGDFATLGEDVP